MKEIPSFFPLDQACSEMQRLLAELRRAIAAGERRKFGKIIEKIVDSVATITDFDAYTDVECGVCNSMEDLHLLLICDGCDLAGAHTYCVGLGDTVPEDDDDWFCADCIASKSAHASVEGAPIAILSLMQESVENMGDEFAKIVPTPLQEPRFSAAPRVTPEQVMQDVRDPRNAAQILKPSPSPNADNVLDELPDKIGANPLDQEATEEEEMQQGSIGTIMVLDEIPAKKFEVSLERQGAEREEVEKEQTDNNQPYIVSPPHILSLLTTHITPEPQPSSLSISTKPPPLPPDHKVIDSITIIHTNENYLEHQGWDNEELQLVTTEQQWQLSMGEEGSVNDEKQLGPEEILSDEESASNGIDWHEDGKQLKAINQDIDINFPPNLLAQDFYSHIFHLHCFPLIFPPPRPPSQPPDPLQIPGKQIISSPNGKEFCDLTFIHCLLPSIAIKGWVQCKKGISDWYMTTTNHVVSVFLGMEWGCCRQKMGANIILEVFPTVYKEGASVQVMGTDDGMIAKYCQAFSLDTIGDITVDMEQYSKAIPPDRSFTDFACYTEGLKFYPKVSSLPYTNWCLVGVALVLDGGMVRQVNQCNKHPRTGIGTGIDPSFNKRAEQCLSFSMVEKLEISSVMLGMPGN